MQLSGSHDPALRLRPSPRGSGAVGSGAPGVRCWVEPAHQVEGFRSSPHALRRWLSGEPGDWVSAESHWGLKRILHRLDGHHGGAIVGNGFNDEPHAPKTQCRRQNDDRDRHQDAVGRPCSCRLPKFR